MTREKSTEVDSAAAEWAVRVDAGPLDAERQAELESWLGADTRRLGAYARARAVLFQAQRAKALGAEFDPDLYADAELSPGAIPLRSTNADDEAASPPTRRRVLIWGGSAVAASALAAVGLSFQAAAQTFTTRKGEIRLVPLADGSRVTLNTASKIRVRLSEQRRYVELIDGEALFEIAPDRARPFIVEAGRALIRAVGTSFSVRRLDNEPVEVLVQQGVVEVGSRSASSGEAHRLVANTSAITSPSQPLSEQRLSSEDVARQLAWREGMLAFEDMPLREAAAEFARYNDVQIAFADPSIGEETVTGLYAANDPRGFAKAAALSLGLTADNAPDQIVLQR